MIQSAAAIGAGVLVAALIGLAVWRGRAWKAMGQDLLAELEIRRQTITPSVYDPAETVGLPEPVSRYFETVLVPGQPQITAVTIEHDGSMDLGGRHPNWKPFTSVQRVTVSPPGFDWFGRVPLMPGVAAEAHDAYAGGRGILRVRIAGVIPLVDMEGTAEIGRGELMRYLAEAAWYPTALLPSRGVVWEAVDTTSARASLDDGVTRVTLLFRFAESGLIESVHAEDRPMMGKNGIHPMPWEGRWTGEMEVAGMRVPREGEVAWLLPEGRKPYWRGRVKRIGYEFADAPASPSGLSVNSG